MGGWGAEVLLKCKAGEEPNEAERDSRAPILLKAQQAKERRRAMESVDRPVRCLHCGHMIASSCNGDLYVGGVRIIGEVLIECPYCHNRRKWVWQVPSGERADTV